MRISKAMSTLCQDLVTTKVVEEYAKEHNMNTTDALRYFMGTKTWTLLQDTRSFFYLENAPYILDMISSEEKGDWERWCVI
ncbi:MAG: hypothetical protein LBM77_10970 [Spirochaetaceae bacterium]|nr:hypothetical protein [Spirochaetaceae bacterium]